MTNYNMNEKDILQKVLYEGPIYTIEERRLISERQQIALPLWESAFANRIPCWDIIFDPATLDPTNKKFSDHACACPNQPGCYAWIDSVTGEVLRVGKGVSLRSRLQRYWYGSDSGGTIVDGMTFFDEMNKRAEKDYWTMLLVAVWLTDDNDTLERRLIEHFMPRYNIHTR